MTVQRIGLACFNNKMGDEMAGEFTRGPRGRAYMVQQINEKCNRRNIQDTVAVLGDLAFTGDFLDICNKLGVLDRIHRGDFARYRSSLPIPAVNQALITAAFRHALTAKPNPIPLRLLLVSGYHEIVTITGTATEISVVVTRNEAPASEPPEPAPPPSASPASTPRKRAARKR